MGAIKSNDRLRAMINQNFVIQIIDRNTKKRKIIGAGQYSKELESEELKIKHFKKVLEGGLDKYVFLLRRGLKIQFLPK